MRAYIIKRLLLMVPTLFGITMVVWIIVTMAPGDPGGQSFAEAMTQKGAGTGESRRIFRTQFNLDKPLFWNYYPSLTAEDLLQKVLSTGPDRPLRERNEAADVLEDWGYYAVPQLVGALDLTDDPLQKTLLLFRLQRNGKRVSPASLGRRLTDEERELNREILRENLEIKEKLALDGEKFAPAMEKGDLALLREEIDRKVGLWKAWYEERKERWELSGWEAFKAGLFDTKFAKFWGNALRFDLGISHVHKRPVLTLIWERMRISLTLAVTALILAYLISVPLGIWGATKHKQPSEQAMTMVLFMLYSLPNFFTATLVLKYFGIEWQLIPVQGFESDDVFSMTTWEHFKDIMLHSVAPIFCMTYASLAYLSRYAKTGLLNVIRSDYVRTARAKGLSEWMVIMKHAVRNGIIPIITLLGTTLPVIIGGSVIIETVFTIPGMGWLMIDSIYQRDYNVVIGVFTIIAILTMVGILLGDILYAVVDPRISFS